MIPDRAEAEDVLQEVFTTIWHKAHQFDIGVYFEANGHGTVLFSERFTKRLQVEVLKNENFANTEENIRAKLAIKRLHVST